MNEFPMTSAPPALRRGMTTSEITEWLRGQIAGYMDVPIDRVDVDTRTADFGIDSVHKAMIAGELADSLDLELELRLLEENPTIRELAETVARLAAPRA